jgi:hypothetical protein
VGEAHRLALLLLLPGLGTQAARHQVRRDVLYDLDGNRLTADQVEDIERARQPLPAAQPPRWVRTTARIVGMASGVVGTIAAVLTFFIKD